MTGKIYIGTSGWNYAHWKGKFYPAALPHDDEFDFYAQKFNTVELNNSFYRLPEKETFHKWRKNSPDDFIFSVKAPQFITHMKKLKDPVESTHDLLLHIEGLGSKLGPVLFQLPPLWNANTERLLEFMLSLPRKFRYTFEFRSHSWYDDSIYRLLEKYNCAFCIYHLAGHLSPIKITADFVYIRLHGPGNKYQGNYTEAEIRQWADLSLHWSAKGKDVYVYFDNDQNAYAAKNALRLKHFIEDGKQR
jgi:uncharacterized protein YecE (DUF72 family)